jgi:phage terminase large subunit GpA-like protein
MAWVRKQYKTGLAPDSYLTVDEWADKNRMLSNAASSEPGPWRTSRTPYLREIMEALSPSSPYERVIFMKGAQIGATEMALNWLGYIIDKSPGPTLLVAPSLDMAKDQSKTRIDPMIEDCPTIRGKVAEQRSRDGGNSALMKEFPGGFIAMTGANSPRSMRSKPIRNLFLDEVDSYPGDVGGEGDPVMLATARTRTFRRRKIFMASTPTIEGRSRIESAYKQTDQRRFYVPCPRCGKYQVLTWPHIKWDPSYPEGAWYECEHCGGRIENYEKETMLAKGHWRSEVPGYHGRFVGFFLSSLYSPVGWYSWGEAAVDFTEAVRDQQKLKTFVNTVLGECWQERGDAPEWEKMFMGRNQSWRRGEVPEGGLLLTAGTDVQKDRIEVLIRAWGRDLENWVVDHRVLMGDTADLGGAPWSGLDALMSESFPLAGYPEVFLHISSLALDTGFQTQTCYSWSRKYFPPRVMPIKGQDSLSIMIAQPKAVDVVLNGKRKSRSLKLFNIGVSLLKSELYAWLRLPKPGTGETVPVGYCHLPNMDEEWFKQLCAETMVQHQAKGGHVTYEWVQLRPRNEVLDMMCYSRAAAALCQIDKYTTAHWDRLEETITGSIAPRVQEISSVPVIPPVENPQVQKPSVRIIQRRRGQISSGFHA